MAILTKIMIILGVTKRWFMAPIKGHEWAQHQCNDHFAEG